MTVPIRLRAPNGMSRLDVEETATLADLVRLVREKTGVATFSLKYGWPLQPLDLGDEDALRIPVGDLNLRGETLVVVPLDGAPEAAAPAPSVAEAEARQPERFEPKRVEPDETVVEWPERGGFMVLRVMPDDNSCMFTAFGGAIGISDPSRRLRQEISDYILNHGEQYNKAILGEDPGRYTQRMRQSDTWGGAIELSILSDIYDIEICSIDVKSLRVDRFGENKENRCIILYSGIHYDRIAFTMDLSYPVEVDVTRWATDDDEALERARALAAKLQRLHYYTDTTDFVIRCEDCGWIGQGTRDAAAHEKETGHARFGEMQID
ncbi:hypothetical protein VTK73DRAFT_2067 [Phialemonium thermophilum]|uniref:Ubiquitin thioesterase OTU n=1 Tax=Phialemonium thermophilum TaxID=223376 RepID=A0ABR3VSL4_9PEZI